jgi:hypothetical protein
VRYVFDYVDLLGKLCDMQYKRYFFTGALFSVSAVSAGRIIADDRFLYRVEKER